MRLIGTILLGWMIAANISLEAKQTRFVIAADRDYAPFTFQDAQGKAAGLFVDLWNTWAKENNYTVTYRFYDWDETLEATRKGEVDFHSGTSNDYEWMAVSDPIYEIKSALYAKHDVVINGVKDLKGKRIGSIDAYYGEMVKKMCRDQCRIIIYPTYQALIDAALSDKIDAFIDDVDALTYYFIKHGLLPTFKKIDTVRADQNDLVYAVTRRGNEALIDTINQGLRNLTSQQLLEIENRWLPNVPDAYYHRRFSDISEDSVRSVWAYAIGAIALALVGLLVYLRHLRRMHRHAVDEALKDELTGLYNKRAFERFFKSDATSVALLFVDVDYFKEFNDTYGHPEGDKLLRTIGEILQKHKGHDMLAYRVGGDEFVVALFNIRKAELERYGKSVVQKMRDAAITHTKNPYGIATVTVGASLASMPVSRDTIYACADKALYLAKQQGKNRFEFLPCDQETS